MEKREINVNVNRIKPFIATNPEEQTPENQKKTQTLPQDPQVATDQKEEDLPWSR